MSHTMSGFSMVCRVEIQQGVKAAGSRPRHCGMVFDLAPLMSKQIR